LASLGALAKLQELTLASTQVSDAGLEHLKQLQEHRVLALGKTRVTDKGLKALCALAKLENLDVSETAVTAEGLKTLKTALPGCNVSGGTPPK
jgi:Leucine-rich repeat (LRR) protein